MPPISVHILQTFGKPQSSFWQPKHGVLLRHDLFQMLANMSMIAYDLRPSKWIRRLVPFSEADSGLAQERPCTRCVKRNIGHLCHDEPREGVKKAKSEPENGNAQSEGPKSGAPASDAAAHAMPQQISAPDAGLNLRPPHLPPNRTDSTSSITQADPVSAPQLSGMASGNQSCKLHMFQLSTLDFH